VIAVTVTNGQPFQISRRSFLPDLFLSKRELFVM